MFYLKDSTKEKTSIFFIKYIPFDKKNFKVSTKISVNPKYWDKNKNSIKVRFVSKDLKLFQIQEKLNDIESYFNEFIQNAKINNRIITCEDLKMHWLNYGKDNFKNKDLTLTGFIEQYILLAKIGKVPEIHRKKSVINSMKSFNKKLKEFESPYVYSIFKIDRIYYYKFVKYMQQKNYSVNYIGSMVKLLKLFLSIATKEGLKVHADYKLGFFKILREDVPAVYLSEEEINKIFNLDLSNNKALENHRDNFIIGLWTGLRISDFLNLKKINPNDKFITIKTQKTKEVVVIPLHNQIKEIILNRGMPKTTSDQKFNVAVKKITELAGINYLVKGKGFNTETKRKELGIYPKYKLVSSHTCRRSFATNLYKMQFPPLSIMQITGHKTEKAFLTYIKITPKEHAKRLLNHWEEYYKKK